MSLGVFVHRTDSIYDDCPAERYQFPAQYLGRAQACIGDWIVNFRETPSSYSDGTVTTLKITKYSTTKMM
jgi:putative restriction endonuclease